MRSIGIIAKTYNFPQLFGNQTLFFEEMTKKASELSIELQFFSPSCNYDDGYLSFIYGKTGWREKTTQCLPNVVYDRFLVTCKADKLAYLKLLNLLKVNGTLFLNPHSLLKLVQDKMRFHDFLESHNIPTLNYSNLERLSVEDFFGLLKLRHRFYLKPNQGLKGKNIFFLERKEKNIYVYEATSHKSIHIFSFDKKSLKYFLDNYRGYFLQPNGKGILYHRCPVDIRVIVQNDGPDKYEITEIGVRVGTYGSRVSNLASGGTAISMEKFRAVRLDFYCP